MKRHLPLLAAVLFTGCMSAKFTPWTGAQREWPVSPGTLADTVDGMTVYHGPPAQPYDVIGILQMDGSDWADPIAKAVQEAHKRGGAALIVLDHGKYQAGTITKHGGTFQGTSTFTGNTARTTGSFNATSWGFPQYNETASALVIRFRP